MSSKTETKSDAGVALRVRDVAKRFDAVPALDSVSLHVGVGERLALLGPNGAGKTTLVRCLSGRVRPDEGGLELFGRPLPRKGGRADLGFIPQELAIYPDLTARENLDVFARFHGLRGAAVRDAVDWALEWTGLADRSRELTKGFSGGMKRRVNLACGVLHRPRVLLLDEPTVGVDPQSRERIFAMLDELQALGTSMLLTTHHLDEAQDRCDRIVILDHGRVIAEGTLGALIESTIGVHRRVSFKMLEPGPVPEGMTADGVSDGDPGRLVAEVSDVALELPVLLARIREAGRTVTDVEVKAPSLHAVFLHLTGRELRE